MGTHKSRSILLMPARMSVKKADHPPWNVRHHVRRPMITTLSATSAWRAPPASGAERLGHGMCRDPLAHLLGLLVLYKPTPYLTQPMTMPFFR